MFKFVTLIKPIIVLKGSILPHFRLNLLPYINYSYQERLMLENTLPQLEQLIEDIIAKNIQLKTQIAELEQTNTLLTDENETLQLEALDGEEKQKQTNDVLSNLLGKLQSA